MSSHEIVKDLEEPCPRQGEQPILRLFILETGMYLADCRKSKKVRMLGVKGGGGGW